MWMIPTAEIQPNPRTAAPGFSYEKLLSWLRASGRMGCCIPLL